jgi:hypothetical protein
MRQVAHVRAQPIGFRTNSMLVKFQMDWNWITYAAVGRAATLHIWSRSRVARIQSAAMRRM